MTCTKSCMYYETTHECGRNVCGNSILPFAMLTVSLNKLNVTAHNANHQAQHGEFGQSFSVKWAMILVKVECLGLSRVECFLTLHLCTNLYQHLYPQIPAK